MRKAIGSVSDRAALFGAGLALVLAGCDPTASSQPKKAGQQADPAEITLQSVKLAPLTAAIKAQHGKVVVVDFWGTFCIPCMKHFPDLVGLHKKYGRDGLVCMSVSVDQPEAKANALNFLKKHDATFANYWMDEEVTVWQDKLNIQGVPAVFVFDRSGKLARKFDDDDPDKQFSYADVEKFVKQLLQKK